MGVTIADYLAQALISLVNWLVAAVNAAWNVIDWSQATSAFAFFAKLDAWVPVATLATTFTILLSVATVSTLIKFGQKVIDWLPFT